MRRACWTAIMMLAAMTAASGAWAAEQTVDLINGIGLIDYDHHPDFKVGSWVRYHFTGHSEMGKSDDYTVTVSIPAEERFWGEDCFWVETWLQQRDKPPRGIATLMSCAVFDDSLPIPHMQYFMRKTIDGVDANENLNEQVVRRPGSTLKKRAPLADPNDWRVDTLGVDTVSVPVGLLKCQVFRFNEGKAATIDQRDSTIRTEVRETRNAFYSSSIPVTGLARETVERSFKRRTWAIGRSQEAAPMITMERAIGEARIEAFGDKGQSQLLPKDRQKSLKQWDAEAAQARAAAPANKPASAKKPAPAKKTAPAAKPKS